LVARQTGGELVLRIEDTDQARNREEWIEGITGSLTWLGIDWDIGPVRQSQRRRLYAEAAEKLLDRGAAYYCDCAREDVERRTSESATPGYDRFCRGRGLGPGAGRALRFATPDQGTTAVRDVVRGEVSFDNSSIEDFVLVKSDGAPLFVLANVVDDMDMEISHVVRGEEHLPNTPKALLLWDALGGSEHPLFAHLPVLVNERRQKLSKRRDRVAVEDYREQGYLAAAMRNYLALLGWAPRDGQEMLSTDELIAEFRLEDVNNSPAFFDVRKLTHFNGEYIRAMPTDAFVDAAEPFLLGAPWAASFDRDVFVRMAPLVQERVSTLSEVPAMVDFLFLEEPVVDEVDWARVMGDEAAPALLEAAVEAYEEAPWRAAELHAATRALGERLGRKLAKAQAPVRVAVTGRSVGPPLFESLETLGRDRTLIRLHRARYRVGS
jgi:glutamyl-tRNA synthetase